MAMTSHDKWHLPYQKIDGTEKPLVQGNCWYKSWVGTKIMLAQTHCWYKETIGTVKFEHSVILFLTHILVLEKLAQL
jgi:hypothetical protein